MYAIGILPPVISEMLAECVLDEPAHPCDGAGDKDAFHWRNCSYDTCPGTPYPPTLVGDAENVSGSDVGELHCDGQRDDPGAGSTQHAYAVCYFMVSEAKLLSVASCSITGIGSVNVYVTKFGIQTMIYYNFHYGGEDPCGLDAFDHIATDESIELPTCCPVLIEVHYGPAGAFAPGTFELTLLIE